MKKVLVTGFTPFGGETVNPSYEAVKRLPEKMEDALLYKEEIPTAYGDAGKALLQKIEEINPDIVMMVGQAGGRKGITIEKVAINYRCATLPDNNGVVKNGESILTNAPTAYFCAWDEQKIVNALKAEKVEASVSYTAGTFICNELLYSFLHYNEKIGHKMTGGFIHVPFLPEQTVNKKADLPTMALNDITFSLQTVLKTLLKGDNA